MQAFLDWINSKALVDLPLGGANFTWSNHQSPPSLFRLDRFLVSSEWLQLFPGVSQLALSKPTYDHCPLILDSNCEGWGSSPFRFELMWLEENQFTGLIREWWESFHVEGWAGFRLSMKLKRLKGKIKECVSVTFGDVCAAKASILEELQCLDNKEEFSIL